MSDLDLNKKVQLKNLCEWELAFRRVETVGDVVIPARGVTTLSISEIQAQVYANNHMFTGTGNGEHARIFIDDKDVRVSLGFENEDEKSVQQVLTPDRVKEILAYKTFSVFKKRVEEEVIHDGEKSLLFEEARRQKLNDFEKIQFIEEYTGFKFTTKK